MASQKLVYQEYCGIFMKQLRSQFFSFTNGDFRAAKLSAECWRLLNIKVEASVRAASAGGRASGKR